MLLSYRAVNVGLRGSALVTRTLFLFSLAYVFAPADVGLFGLLTALIATLTSLVSFDFYVVVLREPAGGQTALKAADSYVAVVLGTGMAGALLMLPNMAASGVPYIHWPGLAVLFAVEHWCHESYRILEGRGHVLAASISLFLRSAAWPMLCVIAYLAAPAVAKLSVYAVFYVWLGFSLITAAVFVPRALVLLGWPRPRASVSTVITHAKAAGQLFIATVLHRLLFYADRLLIGMSFGAAFLGFYTFYFTFFGGILALLDAAIFSFLYPQLIQFVNSGDRDSFDRVVARVGREVWIAAGATAAICLCILAAVAMLPGLAEYRQHGWMVGAVFAGCVVVTMSYRHHYVLFALKRDRELVLANAGGMLALLASVAVGFLVGRPEFAAFAIPLAGAAMLMAKRQAAQAALRRPWGQRAAA